METRSRYSFTLSRPGLKAGYRVKTRLRVVDTATIAFSVAAVFGGIFLWFKCLQWEKRLGLGIINPNNLFTFFLLLVILLVLCIYASYFGTLNCLEFVFRYTGMLTPEEARHFPLEWSKKCLAAWPESWQEPQPGVVDQPADETN